MKNLTDSEKLAIITTYASDALRAAEAGLSHDESSYYCGWFDSTAALAAKLRELGLPVEEY